jgi:eukaryotic-like serine/threonine-protein kinase
MTLPSGSHLGAYEVLGPIGAGGMGEVYRGRDRRLERDVAIKMLPESFAADPERLARFDREAKTLASLNHPHIAQIFGVEDLPGPAGTHLPALVMELVEGEDLSVRIARGRLPVSDALPIAQQIADALETAHERGIIHRDLKPANIKVSTEGVVKVLDFGLAKAMSQADPDVNPANSPTMALTGTQAGLILGTAAYMAPEQARGQTVDRRADIWAFGVVLFEMLAGKQAFSGETISDVLASVLKNDLDWNLLPKDLPTTVLSLLRRCLNPDRRNRLRDIGEARIAIGDFLGGKTGELAASPATVDGGRSRRMLLGVVVVLGLTTTVALAALALSRREGPETSRRFVVTPPDGVSVQAVNRPAITLSPDGWTVVLTGIAKGVSNLYVRGPEDFEPRLLAGTEAGNNPVFSPAGNAIAFFADNRLMLMPLGGTPRHLAGVNDPRGMSWIDDATLIYSPESIGGLFELGINGSTPKPLTTLDEKAGERTHRWPSVLPGGRWVLFTVGTLNSPDDYEDSRIDAVDRQSHQRRTVLQGASSARYAASGHLLFVRRGALFGVAFDPVSLSTSGEPVSILQGVSGDRTTGANHIALSGSGALAYVPGDATGGLRQPVWRDLKGAVENIPLPPALYNDIRISPDGTRFAYALGTTGAADIWVYSFTRGTSTRLTFTGVNGTPAWSADGRDVFFSAIQGARTTLFRTSAEGGREPTAVGALDGRASLKAIARDSTWAIVDVIGGLDTLANIARVPLGNRGSPEPLVNTAPDEYAAALAPDERFFAYQAIEAGRPEIYVRAIGASGGRWQVSNAGGEEPMWSPDGKALYYRFESRLMRVMVDRTGAFAASLPEVLFDGVFNLRSDTGVSYDVHPDGKRLLMIRGAQAASSGTVRVITNWLSELRAIK